MSDNNRTAGSNRRVPESDVIGGRNAVLEALRSGREIESLLVARGERTGSAVAVIAKAKAKGIPVKDVSPAKLDNICGGINHQGIAAVTATYKYSDISDMLSLAEERGEQPFIIICDELQDPHNLGAIIRTAEAAGAHGVIVPKRHSAGLTAAVAKSACGALEYVPVARVNNLAATLDELKKQNIWIYAADMDGTNWTDVDYSGGVGLVVGSEGGGVGRLIRDKCDFLVSLPMHGKINSLNASVAAGILMYEIARRRH